MARSLTSSVRDQLIKRDVEIALLAKLEFDGKAGGVNVWTGIGDLNYNGDTYNGIGTLGQVSNYVESAELKATSFSLSLSGIPSSTISLALAEEFQNRRATVWMVFFDDEVSPGMLNDPLIIFRGRMDTMDIDVSGQTSIVTINCENVLANLDRAPMRRYTSEDHNVWGTAPSSSGGFTVYDKGFNFVPGLQDKEIFWGRPFNG